MGIFQFCHFAGCAIFPASSNASEVSPLARGHGVLEPTFRVEVPGSPFSAGHFNGQSFKGLDGASPRRLRASFYFFQMRGLIVS